ncbi:ATP-binding protein [Candidatus Electronema sp. PJ]|uniref:ATP-binding protein n=1 Tax=Candidatus Electronema sp. PJ TaxID=3401572 RepID=UPI003AA7FB97
MKRGVEITTSGIKKVLKNYKPFHGVAEYIWNGFDAKASTVEIEYEVNKLGSLDYLSVKDNGNGIDFDKLKDKFDKFYDSEKAIEITSQKHSSVLHGKNGVGRLTFFVFAKNAEWHTSYQDGDILKSGIIKIDSQDLKNYEVSNWVSGIPDGKGTKVIFFNITLPPQDIEKEIIPFLKKEFCWFLELNKSKEYKIIINGELLDYEELICERDNILFVCDQNNFNIRFIQWGNKLNKEESKFYYINKKGDEIYKDFTTLNRKGDHFYHSVFIESNLFDNFIFSQSGSANQQNLFNASNSPEYKFLQEKLVDYLKSKRKPYLRKFASNMIEEFESKGVFPEYKNSWDEYRQKELKETIIGLYEVQPKVFSNLNIEQQKTFVRFLDLLLDSNERDRILAILDEVVKLEPEEREAFANLFHSARLGRIISAIKLIEDRYKTYYSLKELVFNENIKADEVNHLQTLIENNYWIFGEQYHLVTAAEPKFEEALRRYVYHISGDIYDRKIDHPDKLKEMDIFACRQNQLTDSIENIVVELKHPLKNIGEKEYSQVLKYINVIEDQPEFNGSNMEWRFYLVGRKFDTKNYIKRHIETNKMHGEKGLVLFQDSGRIKFLVKTWSEIFTEFEIRHNFINDKLKLERNALFAEGKTADELVVAAISNSSVSKKEITLPV